MFNGIIYTTALVVNIYKKPKNWLLEIKTIKENKKIKNNDIDIGSSICCNGICLTVVDGKNKLKNYTKDNKVYNKNSLYFEISEETIKVTSIQEWNKNTEINIEFPIKFGDEIDGHFVTGHVDGVTKLEKVFISKNPEKKQISSTKYRFKLNKKFLYHIVPKGCITLNGVALTINKVNTKKSYFEVMIIPQTNEFTNFKNIKEGDLVNFEIDSLSRYIVNYMKNFNNIKMLSNVK